MRTEYACSEDRLINQLQAGLRGTACAWARQHGLCLECFAGGHAVGSPGSGGGTSGGAVSGSPAAAVRTASDVALARAGTCRALSCAPARMRSSCWRWSTRPRTRQARAPSPCMPPPQACRHACGVSRKHKLALSLPGPLHTCLTGEIKRPSYCRHGEQAGTGVSVWARV